MYSIAIRELRNNPANLTQALKENNYVFITKHGKPIGVTIPLTDENLNFGLTRATALQAWRNGDISLGKMAEMLQMEKSELRKILSDMHLPIINTSKQEAQQEAEQLLNL